MSIGINVWKTHVCDRIFQMWKKKGPLHIKPRCDNATDLVCKSKERNFVTKITCPLTHFGKSTSVFVFCDHLELLICLRAATMTVALLMCFMFPSHHDTLHSFLPSSPNFNWTRTMWVKMTSLLLSEEAFLWKPHVYLWSLCAGSWCCLLEQEGSSGAECLPWLQCVWSRHLTHRESHSCPQSQSHRTELSCLSCIECLGLCVWEASRILAGSGVKATLVSYVQAHFNFQGRKWEAVGGVPFESALFLYDLRVTVVDHQMVPIKNVLRFKEIGLVMKLWLPFFPPCDISTGFASVPGPRALPCRVQCKLIPAGPRVILSDPSELFIVWCCRSLFPLLLYAKWGERMIILENFLRSQRSGIDFFFSVLTCKVCKLLLET